MVKKNDNITLITYKIITLVILIVLFAVFYMFFDNTNFGGISNIQEIIKEELLKRKIQKKIIQEKFENSFDYSKPSLDNQYENKNDIDPIKISHKDEKAIDDTTKKIKNVVKDKELNEEKIKPSISQRFFDRLYFSVITGTTLGYGDIYPITNSVKALSMLQTLSTIILILI